MEKKIEKGFTLVSIDTDCSIWNRYGYYGLSQYEHSEKIRVEISIKKKKYLVGIFPTLDAAIKARKIAEKKRDEGTLVEWLKSKPHGNSDAYKEFWKREFDLFEILEK